MKDIIIIGGGAIGCSIARFLSKYDIDIMLLEKNNEVCEETTKANSAIVHGGYDARPGSLKAKFNVEGASMFSELSNDLDFTYKNIGSLVLGFNDDDLKVLKELYDRGITNGVPGLEIIEHNKILEMEPFVSQKVKYALYCKSAGIVDPFNYTYAMIENAIENGVKLKTSTEVIDIIKEEKYILVKTNKGNLKTKQVINAGGLYSDKIANMVGDFDFEIIPTIGVYRLLFKNKYQQFNKVLFQTPSEKGKGVLVTPTYAGNTMLGPTSDKIDGNILPTEEESLEIIDSLSKKTIPTINAKNTIRVFKGVRAKPNTKDFMIYQSKNIQGVIHVGGIESPGLSSAPAIGKYVANMVKDMGIVDMKEKEKFISKRKAIPKIMELDEDLRNQFIKDNPLYGNIVCRCESITEGEIVDSINRPAGAITRGGVKRRVRAGMGFCQGNHCAPKVRDILSRELGISKSNLKHEVSGNDIIEDLMNK